MLRADVSARAARDARSEERIVVALGELKVSFGANVVLETGPLTGAFAIAVVDADAHVGGLLVSSWPLGVDETCLDPATSIPVLIESLERMGARRSRLSFATAGEAGVLELLSPALACQAKKRPRRRSHATPTRLALSLATGRAVIEAS